MNLTDSEVPTVLRLSCRSEDIIESVGTVGTLSCGIHTKMSIKISNFVSFRFKNLKAIEQLVSLLSNMPEEVRQFCYDYP